LGFEPVVDTEDSPRRSRSYIVFSGRSRAQRSDWAWGCDDSWTRSRVQSKRRALEPQMLSGLPPRVTTWLRSRLRYGAPSIFVSAWFHKRWSMAWAHSRLPRWSGCRWRRQEHDAVGRANRCHRFQNV